MVRLRRVMAGIAFPVLLACQTQAPASVPPAALAPETLEVVIPDLTGAWSARLRSIYRGVGALGLGLLLPACSGSKSAR